MYVGSYWLDLIGVVTYSLSGILLGIQDSSAAIITRNGAGQLASSQLRCWGGEWFPSRAITNACDFCPHLGNFFQQVKVNHDMSTDPDIFFLREKLG